MSWLRRCASAITSIATIFPLVIVNVMTVTRRPRGVTRIAGRPLANPLWASVARCENTSACRATGRAPAGKWRSRGCRCGVRAYRDVGVEQVEQRSEVAVA